mmetsp:Transcript_9672/g.14493  ORF Transcript_9672/g.14493 Transcript_9672/m.14493 type:complete len:234 (-) Transcript_9672:173-874(-)
MTRSNRKNINGVGTRQETAHIQIMHRHIGKDSSATLDILKGRWGWITGTQFNHNGLSHLLILNRLLDTTEVGIKTTLQSSHELDSSIVTGIDGLNGCSQVGGEGLLAKDVLAVFGAGLDLFRVERGGGADPHSINVGVGDDVHGIRGETGNSKLSSGCLGLGYSRIGNNNRLYIRSLGDGTQMYNSNTSTSNNSNSDFLDFIVFHCHLQSRSSRNSCPEGRGKSLDRGNGKGR